MIWSSIQDFDFKNVSIGHYWVLTPNCDANKTCLLLIVPCPQESNKKTEANELSMDSVGGVFVVLIGEKEDAGDGFFADDMLVVIVDDCDGDWELQF